MADPVPAKGLSEVARAAMQARLDQSQALMMRTMQEWGVTPHDLEGRFIEALRLAQTATAEIVLAAAVEVARFSDGLDRHAEALTARSHEEIARLKHATARTELLNKETETKTFDALVSNLSDRIQEKIEAVMVLRARRWDRITYWRASAIVAAVGLALLIGGYRWKTSVDVDANTLFEACRQTVTSAADGSLWCPIPRPSKAEGTKNVW